MMFYTILTTPFAVGQVIPTGHMAKQIIKQNMFNFTASQVSRSISLQYPSDHWASYTPMCVNREWCQFGDLFSECVLRYNGPVCLHSTLCQTGYVIVTSTGLLKQLAFGRL